MRTFSSKIFGLLLFLTRAASADAAIDAKIESTLAALTPLEKIGQMILVYHSPPKFLLEHHIGGVLVMSPSLKNPDKLKSQLDSVQSLGKIGLMVAIDQEGGRINRLQILEDWKETPTAFSLARQSGDSISAHTEQVGKALQSLKINVNLSPVLDPTHNWKGEETFLHHWERSFGRSEKEITNSSLAYVKGFQKSGVMCISKHFPGYNVAENSDLTVSISEADSQSIWKNIEAFSSTSSLVGGIMMSSIIYTNLDNKPAVFSPKVVALARALDSNLMIMTDDLWGKALRNFVSPEDSGHSIQYPDEKFSRLVEMAFWAGNDILMITYPDKVKIIQHTLLNLTNRDSKAKKRLDDSCRRILRVKARMELF